MSILLIEDNPIVARIVRRFLSDHQHGDLVHVPSAEDAFVDVYQRQYRLIIIDWMLPGVNGLEFVRHLRAHPLYEDVPIIMFTNKDRAADVEQAMEAGVSDYIRKPSAGWKPVDVQTLVRKVRRWYQPEPSEAREIPDADGANR